MRISTEVMRVLDRCTADDNVLRLPSEQLDRKLYLAVNKAMEAMGGKWNRKAKGHVFADSVDAMGLLEQAIETGEVLDVKQELGYFPTPRPVVDLLLEYAEIEADHLILEPSAGEGAIAFRLVCEARRVHVCEIHYPFRALLMAESTDVRAHDFLQYDPGAIYDRIVANPPFSRQQDIDHVAHMLDVLKPGGIVVSVMCASVLWRENRKTQAFRNRLTQECEYQFHELPESSFRESGTMVRAGILVARKNAA